jgi:hypothetical protein
VAGNRNLSSYCAKLQSSQALWRPALAVALDWHWTGNGTGTTLARAHYHTTCHFGPQQPLILFPPHSGSAEASDAAGNARPSGGRPMGWRCVQQPAARLVSWSAVAVVAPLVGTPFSHSSTPSPSPSPAGALAQCPLGEASSPGVGGPLKRHPTRAVRLAKEARSCRALAAGVSVPR